MRLATVTRHGNLILSASIGARMCRWQSSIALLAAMILLSAGGPATLRAENVEESLARMICPTEPIGRSNAISTILRYYRPDSTIRGLLFLPSVADRFYLIERDQPLEIRGSNLWQVVSALTNKARVQLSFQAPLLIIHSAADRLTPDLKVQNRGVADDLTRSSGWPRLLLLDQHWRAVQPELSRRLKRKIIPASASEDAWHFGRLNIAGGALTDWQLLQALSLGGQTTITLGRRNIGFSERRTDKAQEKVRKSWRE